MWVSNLTFIAFKAFYSFNFFSVPQKLRMVFFFDRLSSYKFSCHKQCLLLFPSTTPKWIKKSARLLEFYLTDKLHGGKQYIVESRLVLNSRCLYLCLLTSGGHRCVLPFLDQPHINFVPYVILYTGREREHSWHYGTFYNSTMQRLVLLSSRPPTNKSKTICDSSIPVGWCWC